MVLISVPTVRGFRRTVRYGEPRTPRTGPPRRKKFPELPVPARPEGKILPVLPVPSNPEEKLPVFPYLPQSARLYFFAVPMRANFLALG